MANPGPGFAAQARREDLKMLSAAALIVLAVEATSAHAPGDGRIERARNVRFQIVDVESRRHPDPQALGRGARAFGVPSRRAERRWIEWIRPGDNAHDQASVLRAHR